MRTAAALVLALALSGCAAALRPPAPQRLRVTQMTPTFGEEGRGQLALELMLDNSGGAGQLTAFRCDVYLNSRWFASAEGRLNRPLSPWPQLPIQLSIPWALRRSGGGPPTAEEKAGVEVRGELEVSHQGRSERIPFQHWSYLPVRASLTRSPDEAL